MANNVCGVRVAQNYRYKFVCAHCQQEVTKDSFAEVMVIAGNSTKATTTFTITSAGYNALVAQGRILFPQLHNPVREMFETHNYQGQKYVPLQAVANVSAGHIQGLNDECTFCKKIQHWHDFSTSGLTICIVAATMVGLIAFFASWLICYNFIDLGNPTSPLISAGIAFVLSAAIFIWLILDDNRIQAQRKELEHLEKSYPTFIGWGAEWDEPRNMKIYG